jgi:hypothetical protein
MWKAQFEKVYPGVTKEAVWSAWVDVNNWNRWDKELEFTRLETAFEKGATFKLKSKGGPEVAIELIDVVPHVRFTDITRFPLATMYDSHELEDSRDGLTVKSTIWVEGPLRWIWRKIVAQGVADGVAAQTEALVAYAKASGPKGRQAQ